jgi:hypothetical protein
MLLFKPLVALCLCTTPLGTLNNRIERTHHHLATANLTKQRRAILGEYLADAMRARYFHYEFLNVTVQNDDEW